MRLKRLTGALPCDFGCGENEARRDIIRLMLMRLCLMLMCGMASCSRLTNAFVIVLFKTLCYTFLRSLVCIMLSKSCME